MAREAADQRITAGQLALEIMHEIRNPLETLGHLCYLAEHEAENPAQVRNYMAMAEEQLRTLGRIASQTLSFAKLSQESRPIDLVTLAEAALRIHQRTVEARRIHLVRKLPRELTASIQASRILQVLSNLIGNALEAMPDEGQLTFRIRKCSGCVEFVVADNGSGIAPEAMEKLFRPFFTTKETGGNGLGLSLSKRIVEDHGGKISVRSSVHPRRHGSVFKVRLPH
ncbi:sensor histidine kinase [Terriglobus aquaticus]|uniref:histidine kinase n=1 Tax=Terriglobus aquaticus TaxID=940139 RepID=A0ABW9KEX4_9BACT|nr:ATP-binding protein [Terriglobus aquaticus]